MSVKYISQVWEDQTITDRCQLLVMLALADYSNSEGECWPSIESVARKARCSVRTVFDCISALEKAKLIERCSGKSERTANVYKLFPDYANGACMQTGAESSASYSAEIARQIAYDPSRTIKKRKEPEGTAFALSGSIKASESGKKRSTPPPIPEPLAKSERFCDLWPKWLDHLKIKRCPATPYTQELQLKRMMAMGSERAVETIEHAMEKGWRGLYEPTNGNGHNANGYNRNGHRRPSDDSDVIPLGVEL